MSIYTFKNEDHTLGNIIRTELLENDDVSFAAYKVAEGTLHIQIETMEGENLEALNNAINTSIEKIETLLSYF